MASEDVFVVLCTAPTDPEVHARLARGLVQAHLAACVNVIGGLRSFYRWEDAVQDDEEVQMLIKTTGSRLEAVKAYLAEHHPYEVPEVLALPVADGGAAYLDWVRAETRG